ncbi:MAG: spore germination protein, partial [Clostridiales bacterium]
FIQLLILEFMIDGLRLASLNTPSNLSSTLGIIGGLLLSEFAIQAQWFSMETILYMAFVAIASYAQPSFEMGYALKFSRIFLLFCCQFFNLGGIIGGTFLLFLLLLCTKTMTGYNYLYPLIPFDGYKLYKIFFRSHLK